MATIPQNDPFAGSVRIPSLSWRELPIGSTFTLRVDEAAKLLQGRNFDTGELDFWDDAKTQPRMSAVINVTVLAGPHSVGEARSVWAQKPSDLFVAIAEAQKTAGQQIAEGGTLHLKLIGQTPKANPHHSPIKNYAAKYDPPVARDVFGDQAQAAQPVQPGQAGQTRYAQPQPASAQPTPPAGGFPNDRQAPQQTVTHRW